MTNIEESQNRLLGLPVPYAEYETKWRQLMLLASPTLIQALDDALGDGTSLHDKTLISATCQGYGFNTKPIGKGGKFKPSTSRFIHHAINTVGIIIQSNGPRDDEKSAAYLEPIRRSYQRMKREYGSRNGPLNKREVKRARTYALSDALRLTLRPNEIDFFADHYDEMAPYLDLIIQRRDMSTHQVSALLETSPEPVLAAGAL